MSDSELSLHLETVTKKRGRPSTGKAKSGADRVREHRARKKAGSDQGGWVKRSDYEAVAKSMRFYRDSMWKMEGVIAAMQREEALSVQERAKAWAEVRRLQAELASLRDA